MSKDFGAAPLYGEKDSVNCDGLNEGGYPTTIPSKFISADGRSMWVQSNSWERWNYACGTSNYNFSLRKLEVEPFVKTTASNPKDASNNLAKTGEGVTPIEKSAVHGKVAYYNDGNTVLFESSADCDKKKTTDFWGFEFSKNYFFSTVTYTSGKTDDAGGWFANDNGGLRVQVRRNFQWIDVKNLSFLPTYPYNKTASGNSYQINFEAIEGNGIRIIGQPGGSMKYSTIAELEVYYR